MNSVRKGLAVLCHHCPMCRYARSYPQSILGKLLHHRLHADYCPMWKAEKAVYGAEPGTAGSPRGETVIR